MKEKMKEIIRELNNMMENNDFDLNEYINIRDSKAYLMGLELMLLNEIEDILNDDEEGKGYRIDMLSEKYDSWLSSVVEKYSELCYLIPIDTIKLILDSDKLLIRR